MQTPQTDRELIRSGTVLIEKTVFLPESLRLGNDTAEIGWVPVAENVDRRQLENKLSAAGWTFFFMAHAVQTTAFGFNRPKAIHKALQRLIAAVEHKKCNSLEVESLAEHSFWGFPYVKLTAHPRHIQKGAAFRGKA